jgi:hypothetical protein
MEESFGSAEVTGVNMVKGHRYADQGDDFFQEWQKMFPLGSDSFILHW